MESTRTSRHVQWGGCTLHRSFALAIAAVLLLAAACEPTGPVSDSDAEQDANYQRAKRLCEQKDFPAAATFYERALAVNPDFANGHLEVGLLYENQLADPISAVYHYRRFLELRPDSEKRQVVEDFIERAKVALTAKSPQSPIVDPSELTRLEGEKAALLQENASLRARISELEKAANDAPTASAQPPSPSTAPAVAPSPMPTANVVMAAPPLTLTADASTATESPRVRTYVVQRGDTLQSLALRYYGSRSGWDRIFQANRSGLASKDQLKVGQVLIIP
ncbi:MAG TPA: LysM peptidoglycan-binding domain-containing protein [Verrucomicrobiae bacterium]|nr:LysM peptidoglycan-binding domain-containing protein [Verrucomicrobiae bacterium]